jgi:pimeloyl-ACP methyl ester carboxylesterase
MHPATRQRFRLSGGTELSFITAGDPSKPAVLLLHGSPSSARMFLEVVPELSQAAYVIAPDLPGFGESDILQSPSFPALGQAMLELLDQLSIESRYIYLHDYGAPVGLHIAMQAPGRVLGLIIQNANAHRTGLGPQWDETQVRDRAPHIRGDARYLHFRCAAGRGRAHVARSLGGGLAGDELAGPDGHAAGAHQGLWEIRRAVRRHRRISRALATACADGLGQARSVL